MVFIYKRCVDLGWNPPKEKGQFDLLPIVVHAANEPPRSFDVSDLVLEVTFKHPKSDVLTISPLDCAFNFVEFAV